MSFFNLGKCCLVLSLSLSSLFFKKKSSFSNSLMMRCYSCWKHYVLQLDTYIFFVFVFTLCPRNLFDFTFHTTDLFFIYLFYDFTLVNFYFDNDILSLSCSFWFFPIIPSFNFCSCCNFSNHYENIILKLFLESYPFLWASLFYLCTLVLFPAADFS